VKLIRTFRPNAKNKHDVSMLPVDHILDCDKISPEERRRMIDAGEAEWRTNLDVAKMGQTVDDESIFVCIPAAERAN
jgi:hypothetical protein